MLICQLQPHNDAFVSATFTLTRVEILKRVVQPTLAVINEAPLSAAAFEEAHLLKTLANANENHERLREVADEHKALVHRNAVLKECRNLVQSVEASFLAGSIHFKLETGLRQTDFEGESCWVIEPLADEEYTIPISSIADLRITLAGVPWCNQTNPVNNRPPHFTEDPAMILKFSHSISAIFLFDGSLLNVFFESLPGGPFQYIHHTLLRASGLRITGLVEPLDPEPEFTMRFLSLQVRLDAVESHLNLLGVDTTASEEQS